MAQNYKRHARGGSFKRDNIGDGGLSEYRRQQGEIIDSLKLQQARTDEYSKEYLSATKGVDQKEAENFMWDYRPVVFQLDDGTWIIPMCDDEGNNGGALAVGPDETLPVLRGDD